MLRWLTGSTLLLLLACGDSTDMALADAGASDDVGSATGTDSGSSSEDAGATPVDSGSTDSGLADAAEVDAGLSNSWNGEISGLFDTYCVECHGAGNTMRDYSTYPDAFRDRDEIRCGVAPAGSTPSGCVGFPPPAQFPVGSGPFPSDAERQQIVDWIEAGAPES